MQTYILTRNTLYNVVTFSDSKQNKHGFARGKNCHEGHEHIKSAEAVSLPKLLISTSSFVPVQTSVSLCSALDHDKDVN